MAEKRNYGTADSDANGASHGTESRPDGAPPSNTAPYNCNWTDDFVFLRRGVDTLQLSYRGELTEEWRIRLDELKHLAQSDNRSEKTYAQADIAGRAFSVLPKGGYRFDYVLIDPWFRISLTDGKSSMPLAFVQIKSEPLTMLGAEHVETQLLAVLSKMAVLDGAPNISRIDLCVDFSTRFDMETLDRDDWVTRAQSIWQHVEKNNFTGWSIGIKGNVSCRLYDKTAEIRVSNKDFFEPVWRDCGWNADTPVWRLEFQVKREVLRQLGISTFADIEKVCSGLWPYLSVDWLRLTIPSDSDSTRSRWPTHPLWEKLSAIEWSDFDSPSLRRVYLKGRISNESMLKYGSTGILGFMAIQGIDDFSEGCRAFEHGYLRYLDDTSPFRDSSAEEFVEMRIREIVRKNFLRVNDRPGYQDDPVESAVERNYRKAKDGE